MGLPELLDLLMFATACVFLLSGFPVAFTLGGTALLFAALATLLGVFDVAFLTALPHRIFGTMTNEVLIAVPLFVVMGVMLERSKVAEDLLDNMGRLFGKLRGGLGISVSVVGALLAASTGIVGATVVTMGLISLPTMLRRGYDPRLACGSIAAAGTLGQIIPPSIVLVLLGDVLSSAYQQAQLAQGIFSPDTMSVGDLFAGALIPGIGLVVLYILYQIGMAIWRPKTSPAIEREPGDGPDKGRLLRLARALIAPLVLIVAVLGSILAGIATPTEAAAVGAVGALMLAGQRLGAARPIPVLAGALGMIALVILTTTLDLRLGRNVVPLADRIGIALAFIASAAATWGIGASLLRTYRAGVLVAVMRSSTRITAMVFAILIGAAVFSLVFRGLGGDEAVTDFLANLPGGRFAAVALVMAVMFVLGFFLDFIEITFVVVPIVAPALLMMGFDPVWLGVMMAVNLQTSFLTPPFGFALFYLRGVAPDGVSTGMIYRGVAPFVAIQLIALLLLTLMPGLATWLPSIVFE